MSEVEKGIVKGADDALAYLSGDNARAVETVVTIPRQIDIKAIRKKLRLSQTRFASVFGFDVTTLRNWEQGRRVPNSHTRAYLQVIANDPMAVERALAKT